MFSVVTNHKSVRMMHVSWVESGLGFWGCANEIQRIQDVPLKNSKKPAQQRGRRQRPWVCATMRSAPSVAATSCSAIYRCFTCVEEHVKTQTKTNTREHAHKYAKTAAAATAALEVICRMRILSAGRDFLITFVGPR